MPGEATKLGPFTGGLHNASGSGEFIQNEELYDLTNLEVDTDGSLVNRPQINNFIVTGIAPPSLGNGMTFIGTYLPSDGRKFIVAYLAAAGQVRLIDATTGALDGSLAATKAVCCIQYGNKLYVVATPDSPAGGGYFDVPTISTTSWTNVATMPRGEAVAQYRERIWIACGMSATSNTSRFFFSAVADPTSWTGTDFIDVAPGNGQKLVSLVRLGNDLVLFKEHSTHKFTYTTDPRKAELNEIDATIGVPAINCNVVYNNNTIYTLHDNAVYELFQYTYTRISALINMEQVTDLDLFAKDQYGLTLHRDRLFVRYFKNLYVYNLRVKRWCKWVSDRKFSHLVVIPTATVGLDTAYTTSASQARPAEAYSFQDVRSVDYSGNTALTAPSIVGTGAHAPTGTTSTLTPHVNTVAGDWMYVFWYNLTSGGVATTVTPPAGWTVVQSRQLTGDLFNGAEYSVYRKKFVLGEVNYVFTASQSVSSKNTILTVRNAADDMPVMGAPNNANAVGGSITAPGVASVVAKSMVLSFFGGRRVASAAFNYILSGSGKLGSIPAEGNTTQGWQATAWRVYSSDSPGDPVTLTYTPSDTAPAFGVSFSLLPANVSSPVGAEVFQGIIQTKTYDFDLPQSYKVLFWWGIALATSGKTVAVLTIPNANRNMTYRQALTQYGTWATAIAAKQTWASNTPITIDDTVYPSLGKYARKFLKILKKVRFRQIYFTLTVDVVTNGGIADAALRLYDLTVLIKAKETVVKETS